MAKLIAKVNIIYGSFSQFRGFVRFGMYLPTISKIFTRMRTHRTSPVRMMYSQTITDIFGILCLLFDHPAYLIKVGLLKMSEPKKAFYAWWCITFWFLMVVGDIICTLVYIQDDLIKIQQLKQRFQQMLQITHTIIKHEDISSQNPKTHQQQTNANQSTESPGGNGGSSPNSPSLK